MSATETYRPSLVSWNLTKKCNLDCPHCYLGAGDRADVELTTGECFDLIDELQALGTEMLILTGGEPLLRRDIFEIASRASEKGIWVVMGTNGIMVNEHVAEKLVASGVKGVGISLDSINPETHNRFRGSPDAWRLAVQAMDICRQQGLEVLVQTTVMSDNLDEIEDLIRFARDRGAWSFNAYFLVRTGRGATMTDLTPDETETCLRQLIGLQQKYAPLLIRAKCAPQFKQLAWEMGLGGLESGGCMSGRDYCRITPEADVTPCPYMDVVAGNTRTDGMATVWDQSDVLTDLRNPDRLKGRCGICEFRELCGGCRCRAYAATGDYLAEDPACLYQPGTLSYDGSGRVAFSENVIRRLERIPISFIRNKVRKGLLAHAARHGLSTVTSEDMERALASHKRGSFSLPGNKGMTILPSNDSESHPTDPS